MARRVEYRTYQGDEKQQGHDDRKRPVLAFARFHRGRENRALAAPSFHSLIKSPVKQENVDGWLAE